jgi:hypothetical protein
MPTLRWVFFGLRPPWTHGGAAAADMRPLWQSEDTEHYFLYLIIYNPKVYSKRAVYASSPKAT